MLIYSTLAFGVSKVIDGGAGVDSLQINLGKNLEEFSSIIWNGSNSYNFRLDESDININNIETLTVNSVAWTSFVGNGSASSSLSGACNSSRYDGVYASSSVGKMILFDWDLSSSSNYTNLCLTNEEFGRTFPESVTIYGSDINDVVNVTNDSYRNWIVTTDLGAGDDQLRLGSSTGRAHDIDMGSGDDRFIAINLTNGSAYDGGSGNDWIGFFHPSTSNKSADAQTYTLNSGVTSNFENIWGSMNGDVLTGDSNANIIIGAEGSDTLNGGAGNDILWGDCSTSSCYNLIGSSYADDDSDTPANDIINGGDGDDILYGDGGDDTLNGGAGNDTIISGAGSDIIIITSSSDSDTLTDFTDGTDAIAFDSSINSSNLIIAKSGSDTVIKNGSNTLLTLTGIPSANITAVDLQSTSTDAQTLNGSSGNDILVGGAGNDVFNGGAGSDQLVGWGGDDTFNITNKTGSWSDVINGGAGTDVLNVSYGISLEDFSSIVWNGSTDFTFLDSSGGSINFDLIETLTVNSVAWTSFVGNGSASSSLSGACNSSRYDGVYASSSVGKMILFDWDLSSSSNYTNLCLTNEEFGRTFPESVTIYGSDINDVVNVTNDSYRNWIVTTDLGAGDDQLRLGSSTGRAHDIDMGSGDDRFIAINLTNGSAYDGGSGNDWIGFFHPSTSNKSADAQTYTLNSGVTSNFENIWGSMNGDVLTGDSNANIIIGAEGSDTLNGGAGNDILWGDCSTSSCYNLIGSSYADDDSDTPANDIINGGDGDDILYGDGGDDTLNGGAGNDIIYSGNGSDTIVTRSGDGGSSITDADTIKDFTDGRDTIGLSGLNYSDLTVQQGTGSYSSHVVVQETSSGDFLLILQNQSISNIDDNDFSAI